MDIVGVQGRSDGSQLIEADAALTADGVHGRWRRHIGSVAAFGGFPISYNRNRANRLLSSAIISHQSWYVDSSEHLRNGNG